MITITKGERKDNKKGPWLHIWYVDDRGQEKEKHIFKAEIIDGYKGPGKYDASFVKEGQYWNIAKLELMALDPKSGSTTPIVADYRKELAEDAASNVALQALKYAVKIIAAAIAIGSYKGADIDTIGSDVAILAARFLRDIEALTKGMPKKPAKEEKNETTISESEGA